MAGEILLTGAAGRVATALRPMLRRHGHVRLSDRRAPDPAPVTDEDFLPGDLIDAAAAEAAVAGVDTIVHLAGHPDDAGWSALLPANVTTTANLIEAALRRAASEPPVATFVYASSIHVLGGHNDPDQWPVADDASPEPCCRYGASKLAAESLLRWFAGRSPATRVVCLRLPLVTYPPRTPLEFRSWLAVDDLSRLVASALRAPAGFTALVATSECTDPRFDIRGAEDRLGYRPQIRADSVALADRPPEYSPDCTLWRLPQGALRSAR